MVATTTDYSRVYWQCRRGMRELDLLLQTFLDKGFAELSKSEKKKFDELLEYPDTLLLEYLMGRMTPTDPKMAAMVDKIRHANTY